jgi:hypothetical protein
MSSFNIDNPIRNLFPLIEDLNRNLTSNDNSINYLNTDVSTLNLEQDNTNNRTKKCYVPLLWNELVQLILSNRNPCSELESTKTDLPPTITSRYFYIFQMWYYQLYLTLLKKTNTNIFPSWFSYSLSFPNNLTDNLEDVMHYGLYYLLSKINNAIIVDPSKTLNIESNAKEILDFKNSVSSSISVSADTWIISQTDSYWNQVIQDYSTSTTNPTWTSTYTPPVSPVDGEWRGASIPQKVDGSYFINSWGIPWPADGGYAKTQGYATPNWGGVIGYEWHRTGSTGTNISGFPTSIQNTLNTYVPQLSGSNLLTNMNQVLSLNGTLTPREKFIAEFWEDGYGTAKPCGKWNFLTRVFIRSLGYSEEQCIELLFLVNAALVNAFICAWDVKRIYAAERPVTYLRRSTNGTTFTGWKGNIEKTGDVDTTQPNVGFLPYQDPTFITPPFPGFISGHSTCSAAAATILKTYIGDNTIPQIMTPVPLPFNQNSSIEVLNEIKSNFAPYLEYDTSKYTRVLLCFKTFDDMIESAGWSRLYGGIHILPDHQAAVEIGKYLANYTLNAYRNKL